MKLETCKRRGRENETESIREHETGRESKTYIGREVRQRDRENETARQAERVRQTGRVRQKDRELDRQKDRASETARQRD